MKRFGLLSFLLTLLAAFNMAAQDMAVTLNIARPQSVTVTVGSQTIDLVSGANQFTLPEYATLEVRAVAPYILSSITNANGTPYDLYGTEYWSYYNWGGTGISELTVNVQTKDLNSSRTATCTVNVDDASRISAQLSGFNAHVDLVDGANTVKFDPDQESTLQISSTNYAQPFYSVSVDGAAVHTDGMSAMVPIYDGCQVDITAIFPDIDCVLSFTYGENAQGAITGVTVNNTELEFNGANAVVKAGDNVQINPDSEFKFDAVTVNGDTISWSGTGPYNFIARNDMAFHVEAHPYGVVAATVIIDNPERINFYRGWGSSGELIEGLVAGNNTIEVSEAATTIAWDAVKGNVIDRVIVNDTTEYTGTSISLIDGMKIEVYTSAINYDQKAVIWTDCDIDALSKQNKAYYTFCGQNRESIELSEGYNEMPFFAALNPFNLSGNVYDSELNPEYLTPQAYINGVAQEAQWGAFTFEIPNDAVVKMFFMSKPVESTVTFTVSEAELEVTRDIIVPVTDFVASETVFDGTEYRIATEAPVSVNGAELTATDGVYTFVVKGNTEVLVGQTTGIDSVEAAEGDNVIYDLTGRRINGRAQKGIYILNGKKVVIK